MLSITNGVTPEKLNEKQKMMGRIAGLGVIENLRQNPQVLQNHTQIGRKKNLFYQNQSSLLKKSLLG